jgi:hypothetical protein
VEQGKSRGFGNGGHQPAGQACRGNRKPGIRGSQVKGVFCKKRLGMQDLHPVDETAGIIFLPDDQLKMFYNLLDNFL